MQVGKFRLLKLLGELRQVKSELNLICVPVFIEMARENLEKMEYLKVESVVFSQKTTCRLILN